MSQKIGPGKNLKVWLSGWKTFVPMRSDGIRSGVNWMRRKLTCRVRGQRAGEERLGQAGHALENHVAAGQQRDERLFDERFLANDDFLDSCRISAARRERVEFMPWQS